MDLRSLLLFTWFTRTTLDFTVRDIVIENNQRWLIYKLKNAGGGDCVGHANKQKKLNPYKLYCLQLKIIHSIGHSFVNISHKTFARLTM